MKRLFVLACAVVFAFVFIGTAAADKKIAFKKATRERPTRPIDLTAVAFRATRSTPLVW